jgi:hypothetical protein
LVGHSEAQADNGLIASPLLRGVTVVANTSGATVISIKSHPAWAEAERRAHQRNEAMRRHPSFRARQQRPESEGRLAAVVGRIGRFPGADTPA